MKHLLVLPVIILVLFSSCKKSAGGVAKFMVLNETYSVGSLSASINGTVAGTMPLSQGQISGTPYSMIPAGTNNLSITIGASSFLDKNIYTGTTNGYSLLLFDTAASIASPAYLFLTDDLTKPDTSLVKCRFICTIPGDSLVFLLTKKTDSTRPDSVVVFRNFIGSNPTASSVQTFDFAPRHGRYKPFIFDKVTSQLLYTSDSILLDKAQIVSFIYSGLSTGTGNTAPKFSMIVHPPN